MLDIGCWRFDGVPRFRAASRERRFAKHLTASLLLTLLCLLDLGVPTLRAEDAFVTGCVGTSYNVCPPSCPDKLGTTTLHSSASAAEPQGAARSKTMYGITNTASWTVTPTLASSPGIYRVYVSQGTTNTCSTDIVVKVVAVSGCTLADTNGVSQTEIYTAAFQRGACLNVWTPVAMINNTATKPSIKFSYASGNSNRWYMDEARFEYVPGVPATSARITQILLSNQLTISGTGPVSHPFALVSSTDAAKAMNQWSPEQTNTSGSGSFSFDVHLDAAKAKFFRVITQ